jgi:hypothetical protein
VGPNEVLEATQPVCSTKAQRPRTATHNS